MKHTKCRQCEKEAKFGLNDGYYCEEHVEAAVIMQEYAMSLERFRQRHAWASEQVIYKISGIENA